MNKFSKLLTLILTFVLMLQSISCAQNSSINNLNKSEINSKMNNENNVNEEIELKSEEKVGNNNMGNSKTLVIYSSFIGEQYGVGVIEKGNTEIVADMIIENLAADRYKVEPKNDIYPKDSYNKLIEVASKELHDKARQEIKDVTIDISNYDTIFVGAPVCGEISL